MYKRRMWLSCFLMLSTSCIFSAGFAETYKQNSNDNEGLVDVLQGGNGLIANFPLSKYEIVPVARQGLFYLDQDDDCVKNLLRKGTAWEPHIDALIRKYAKPNSTVLDIGAHVGTHTMALSQTVGDGGHVVAFEPQKKICSELAMNLKLNQKKNVTVYNTAVGQENGTVFLGSPIPHNEGARFVSTIDKVDPVRMCTIDSLNLSNVSFAKIDVENFELYVLKGARNTFTREKTVLVVEIQGNHVQASQVSADKEKQMTRMKKEVIQYLEDMGYVVSHIDCDDYLAIPR